MINHFDLATFAYMCLPAAPLDKPVLISNYPPKWTSQYLAKNYQQIDPVLVRARHTHGPFRWGQGCKDMNMSQQQQQVFDEAAVFGILCGLTMSFTDRFGGLATITFAADEMRPLFLSAIQNNEQALQLIATCFHIRARQIYLGDRVVDGVFLTPREYECLQWAAKGKSAWEIGCILGIKRRTVAFHLDNAKQKFGVRTVTQAAVRMASATSTSE